MPNFFNENSVNEILQWAVSKGYNNHLGAFSDGPIPSKDLVSHFQNRTKTNVPARHEAVKEICAKCCKNTLLIKVTRKEKGYSNVIMGLHNNKPIKIHAKEPEWASTAGELSVELWTNEGGKPGKQIKVLMTAKTIELCGPESGEEGSMKMIPHGDHQLWTHSREKAKTVGYSDSTDKPHRKPYPAFGISGPNIGHRTGILFHSGTDYTWLEGCILLASSYHTVGNFPFRASYEDSYNTVVKLIDVVDYFIKNYTQNKDGLKNGNRYLPCIIVRVINEI